MLKNQACRARIARLSSSQARSSPWLCRSASARLTVLKLCCGPAALVGWRQLARHQRWPAPWKLQALTWVVASCRRAALNRSPLPQAWVAPLLRPWRVSRIEPVAPLPLSPVAFPLTRPVSALDQLTPAGLMHSVAVTEASNLPSRSVASRMAAPTLGPIAPIRIQVQPRVLAPSLARCRARQSPHRSPHPPIFPSRRRG